MKSANFTYSYTKWILLALIIIAGVLRFFTLESISLDFEEQLLWFCGTQTTPFDSLIWLIKFKPFNIIIGVISWLTCSNGAYIELINRSVSIIAGVMSVPLIFILTRKFYSEIEGIVAAGFVVFSWNCISASQHMAEYSLLLAFILLYFIALITFLDKIAEKNSVSKQEHIFLIITGLLLGFTSIWGILVIAISFLYIFFFISYVKTFLKTIACFLYIIIPIGLFTWWGLNENIIYTTSKYSIVDYINSINYVLSNNYILSIISIIPIFYLIFVYLKRLFSKNKFGEDAKTKFNNSTLVITIWLMGSIIGFVLLTLLLKIKFSQNDLIFILPPLFILLARSIVLVSSKLKYKIIISSVLCLLFVISTFINLNTINNKPEYNQAIRYIMYSISNDKTNKYGIIKIGNNIFPKKAFSYYLKKNRIKNKIFILNNKNNIDNIIKQAQNIRLDYVWFIADNNYTTPQTISDIKKNELLQEGYRYKGITIYKLKMVSTATNISL